MKKLIIMAVISAILLTAVNSFAKEECSVREAEKLMELNHKSDAINCLETMKTNTGANYLLGVLYFQDGNYRDAQERLSAPAVKDAYGNEIFQLYKSAGEDFIEQADFTRAGDMYEEAVNYRPEDRKPIALDMFERGKNTGNEGFFAVASRLDKDMNAKIGEYYAEQSRGKGQDEEITTLGKAAHYNNQKYGPVYLQKKQARGIGYLNQAKEFAVKPGQEANTEKYRALAKNDLGEEFVERQLPEVVVYKHRSAPYVFKIFAGEQTPHWIRVDAYNFGFLSTEECQWEAVFADGYVMKKNGGGRAMGMATNFKIRAISDCAQNEGGVGIRTK